MGGNLVLRSDETTSHISWEWPLIGRAEELRRLHSAVVGPGSRGVVIVGPAGVGKTRIARELVDTLDPGSFRVEGIVGTASSASIPFGALVPLLPAGGVDGVGPLQLLQAAHEALSQIGGSRRLVLFVDDAHLLDDGSATLLHQLAQSESATLVLTVRTGDALPDPITALWKDGAADRIELTSLSGDDFDSLIESALGAPLDRISRAALWRLCQGNPLLLREMLMGAAESGALERLDRRWTIRGQLTGSGRLNEVVENRLRRLTADQREALEVLAVGQPLGHDVLAGLVPGCTIEALEAADLVVSEPSDRRTTLRIGHPLYAETLRSVIPKAKTRRIQRDLARQVEAAGARRRDDLLRIARWRLDAGSALPPDIGVRAARRALESLDHELAERLARESDTAEGCYEACLVRGEALFHLGRGEEAEVALAEAYALATDEEERARAAVPRAFNLFLALQRWPEAIEFGQQLCEQAETPGWRNEAKAALAAFYRVSGRSAEALTMANEVLAAEASWDRTRARALMVAQACETALGHYRAATEYASQAVEYAGRFPSLRLDELVLAAVYASGMAFGGDLVSGESLAREGYELAVTRRAHEDIAYWGFVLGEILILRGLVADACAVLEETAAVVRIADPLGLSVPVLSEAAQAAVLSGESDMADVVLEEARARRGPDAAGRARAMRLALAGDCRAAALIAAETGRRVVARSDVTWGVFALHDAVRFGHPELVIDDLRSATAGVDGPLLPALLAHAEALLVGDSMRLVDVSNTFEATGANLYAAEAAAHAGSLTDDARLQKQLWTRAERLYDLCVGCLRTPPLAPLGAPGVTPRELEVAQLAAAGHTSREIADRLFISVRTVDNHLASVYTKLGVSGRQELRSVFGPVG